MRLCLRSKREVHSGESGERGENRVGRGPGRKDLEAGEDGGGQGGEGRGRG